MNRKRSRQDDGEDHQTGKRSKIEAKVVEDPKAKTRADEIQFLKVFTRVDTRHDKAKLEYLTGLPKKTVQRLVTKHCYTWTDQKGQMRYAKVRLMTEKEKAEKATDRREKAQERSRETQAMKQRFLKKLNQMYPSGHTSSSS